MVVGAEADAGEGAEDEHDVVGWEDAEGNAGGGEGDGEGEEEEEREGGERGWEDG